MGAKITQARTERELARSIGEARARLAAGALTEAGQWLLRAQKVAPHAPEVAELRQEIERAADGREQERDRQRRVAAALAHARETLKGGAADTALRAVHEALSLSPHDATALALKAEIERARPATPVPAAADRPPTLSRHVGPPPPASARELDAAEARMGTGARAAMPGATPPPLGPQAGSPTPPPVPPFGASVPERRSARLPIAFIGIALVAAIVFGLGTLFVWRQIAGRLGSATPGSAQAPATPSTASPGRPDAPVSPEPASVRAADPNAMADPPIAPPTTAADEDAAITARLADAVSDFQSQRTGPALNTLATLLDEAPARDDLRLTAEQWARALQARAVQQRESARRPRPLPPVMRQANQAMEIGENELAAGNVIAAARAFERSREAWAGIVARQASRGAIEPPATTGDDEPEARPEPRAAARETAREPAPAESAGRVTPPPAMTPEEEFERAQIMRLLQSFKRAFDSRSGDSLRPIWPSLSAGAAQSYHGQWQRALSQQWRYDSVNIRMGGDGRRASVDCNVTVTSLMPGSRENATERRRASFNLERLGPLWVISSVSGI
jgi:hypothetical protein